MPSRNKAYYVYLCHAMVGNERREHVGHTWDVLGRIRQHRSSGARASAYLWPKGPRVGTQDVVLDEERAEPSSVSCADFSGLCRLRAAVPTSCGCADFVRLCRLDYIFGANALPFEIKEGCWNFRFK